ncbi:hypothetical protein CKO28_20300 [Rhodovibrio sodomensis]|uniref:NAD-dependent epimerase/dehydratase domain-containing protein n=1 Tax=Rhodovibrio sodomensis TaxID=1088 RepID=A0ABS1DKQ6_9PROT|nr:hypothetical protein [Rhodovibrio sodomensis]
MVAPSADTTAGPGTSARATRVAVTGAGGFLGRHVVAQLAKTGYSVRALYHRREPDGTAGVEPVRGSLADAAALDRLVAGCDAVIHLAGLVAADRPGRFDAVNHAGTVRLAERAAAARVGRFLFVSSLAARHPALSPYAASKRAGERALTGRMDLPVDVLRPPAVYGPGDPQILMFLRLLRLRIAPLPGPPTARVCLIHADDAASAIAAWLAGPGASGAIYEIADDRPDGYSWRELMEIAACACGVRPRYLRLGRPALIPLGALGEGVARLTGRAVPLSRGKVRELTHPDWRTDWTAFGRRTGWGPTVELRAGLTRTVDWYRAHGWL